MNTASLTWRRGLPYLTRPICRRWMSTENTGVFRIPNLLPPEAEPTQLQDKGLEGLYSPLGFQYAWQDYQSHVINELNQRLTEAQGKLHVYNGKWNTEHLQTIMQKTARKAEHATLFNYASMAFNNHFFFKTLNYETTPESPSFPTPIPNKLRSELEHDFASIDNLKATFLANANAMFGGGFIWLVRLKSFRAGEDKLTNFRILRTYNAGSPLAGAHWRGQVEDMQNISLGDQSREIAKRIAHDAVVEVEPVLCVSVWEHSYIVDWNIQGKSQYLDAWWDRISWDMVEELSCIRDQPLADNSSQRRWGYSNRSDKKRTAPFYNSGIASNSMPAGV